MADVDVSVEVAQAPEPEPEAAPDLAALKTLVEKGDAAGANLDVPELAAMEAAAALYAEALAGFAAAGVKRPKVQDKCDAANDRIADLLVSGAGKPKAAVDWEDISDSGVLAQLLGSGYTGALACTAEAKDINTTFDEASAYGAWDLTQEMSAMARLVRSKGNNGKLAGVVYQITERLKEVSSQYPQSTSTPKRPYLIIRN